MLKDLRDFAFRGNVLDLAVAFILGAAFNRVVQSLSNDLLMPPIGLVLGNRDYANLFLTLKGPHMPTLTEAQQAGAVTLNYGLFLNAVLQFLLVAVALFVVIRQMQRLRREQPAPSPEARACPFCLTSISPRATRCPACTSQLELA